MGTEKRARQKAGRQQRIEEAQAAQHRARTQSRALTAGMIGLVAVLLIGLGLFLRRDTDDTTAADNPPTTSEDGAQIVDRNGEPTETVAPGSAPAEVPPAGAGASITGDTPCPAADGSSERTTSFEKAPPMCIDPAKTYTATFTTNLGSFTTELDAATMPNTVNNFVVLSRYHYYDDTSIFRIAPTIAVFQGGSPTTNSASDPGPGYTIDDEGGEFTEDAGALKGPFSYVEGDLVMARSAGRNSSGAQYFVATGPEVAGLDSQGTYLNFGKVTEGMDVVQQIAALYVPFPAGSPQAQLGGGPKEPVIVESVTITES
jgi:cyclophilin family peptidyl-prolyl cis-trans isomerase